MKKTGCLLFVVLIMMAAPAAWAACIPLPGGGSLSVSPSYADGPYYQKALEVVNQAKTVKMTSQEYYIAIAQRQMRYEGTAGSGKHASNWCVYGI